MASYTVMSWRGIPSQVKVSDETGTTVSRQLPPFFQQQIDRVAMTEGIIESDEYLEAWAWSDERTREGSAEDVASVLVDELADEWRRANPSA